MRIILSIGILLLLASTSYALTILESTPQGETTYGTGLKSLWVHTDEYATCKYSNVSGRPYANMTLFRTTGGNYHSACSPAYMDEYIRVVEGGSYNYYVKCSENMSDYTISFYIPGGTNTTNTSTPTPTIIEASPTGTIDVGTGLKALWVHTDVAATCKYSNVSGKPYANMTPFRTTGANYHDSTTPSYPNEYISVVEGGSYTYYVKCSSNASDYTINFDISVSNPLTGACFIGDIHTGVGAAAYDDPDIGEGYVKYKVGEVTDLADAKTKCTDAIFADMMSSYCALGPRSYCQIENHYDNAQWQVGIYQDGAAITSDAALSGSQLHYCSDTCWGSSCENTGACIVKDIYSGLPGYSDPDIGLGIHIPDYQGGPGDYIDNWYVKFRLGAATSLADVKSICTDQIFENLTATYCSQFSNSTNPGINSIAWRAIYYGDGSHDCAASGCGYHSCGQTSSIMGICYIRDSNITAPGYGPPYSNHMYSKYDLGAVTGFSNARTLCTDSIYEDLMDDYCVNNTAPAKWEVRIIGGDGSNGCAASGCGYHECTNQVQSACSDSDGGQNIYQKGTSTANGQSLSDHCNDDGTLTEKYCENDTIAWRSFSCPSGYSCSDGACRANNNTVTTSPTVTSSSGGGSGGGGAVDKCKDVECTANERRYCDGSNVCVEKKLYDCVNGKCIEKTSSGSCTPCSNGCNNGACKKSEGLVVISPNGGQVWKKGSTQEIKWKTNYREEATLQYSNSDGTVASKITGKPVATTNVQATSGGSAIQTVATAASGKICPDVCIGMWKKSGSGCVYDSCGSGCGADGKTTFKTKDDCEEILPKALGGYVKIELIPTKIVSTITYSAVDAARIPSTNYVISDRTDDDGQYSWSIPETLQNGQYQIRVTDLATGRYDDSDRAFTIAEYNIGTEFVLEFKSGWNMFSIPLSTVKVSLDKTDCVPTSSMWYLTSAGYNKATNIKDLQYGYWVRMEDDCKVTLQIFDEYSMGKYYDKARLHAGWNIIGGIPETLEFEKIKGNCNFDMGPFWYNPGTNQYEEAITMEPGKGYVVKTTAACMFGTDLPPTLPA